MDSAEGTAVIGIASSGAVESTGGQEVSPAPSSPLFSLRDVRKTYGMRRIPESVFRECRLSEEKKPRGRAWRDTCGSYEACRQECPRCWSLSVRRMDLRRDKTTAILGHSGSGKTTLLYLLALLHPPDPDLERFRVRFEPFEGAETGDLSFSNDAWRLPDHTPVSLDDVRRRRFGFVFQAGHLSSHLTSVQNVGLALALAGVEAQSMRSRTEEILQRIEFPRDRFHALPRHLSGGEYQRIAVARALAADPDVLFADEPTGNLDPVTGQAVMELLSSWRSERAGRSLLLVTHNVEHALRFADDLFVLNGGEVVLDAKAEDVEYSDIEEALRRRSGTGGLLQLGQ